MHHAFCDAIEQELAGLGRGVGHVLLVLLVSGLPPAGPHLEHGYDLLLTHSARVVHVVFRQLVPDPQEEENGQFDNGETLEDRGLELLKLFDFGLLVSGQISEVDVCVVVVRHVVVFTKVVVVASDDGCCVDTRNALAILVELDEAVEANVQKCQKVSHAKQRL